MNTRWMVFSITLAATAAAGATEPVTVKASPVTSFAPATVVVSTRIDPDADNRAMEVVAESADFFRSSTMPLEGDRAPRAAQFQFRSLPPGDYDIRVTLIGADGRTRAVARTRAQVVETIGH